MEDQEDVSVIKRTSLAENLGFVSSMDMIVHATCNSSFRTSDALF